MPPRSDQQAEKELLNPGGKELVECPECHVRVRVDRLENHRRKAHTKSSSSLPIRHTRYANDDPSGGMLKPNVIHRNGILADDSGIVVSPGIWLCNQKMGDDENPNRSIGHAAQSSDIRAPEPAFELIKQVPNSCSEEPRRRRTEARKTRYREHNGQPDNPTRQPASCPVLVLQKKQKQKSPLSSPSIKQRFDRLEFPCQVCGKAVSTVDWPRHMVQSHHHQNLKEEQKRYDQQPVRCGSCQEVVNRIQLIDHYRRYHHDLLIVGVKVSQTPSANKPAVSTAQERREALINEYFDIIKEKSFEDSFDEPRDGSKYLGYMERESGKFGSYPLHDDYTEESDSG